MEEVLITNNTKSFRFLPHRGVCLTPGKNRVNKEEWEANLDHPTVKSELANDIYVVESLEEDQEITATIKDEPISKKADDPEETTEGKLKKDLGLLDEDEEKEDLPNPGDYSVSDFKKEVLTKTKDPTELKQLLSKEKDNKDRVTLKRPIKQKLEGVLDE